MMEKANWMVKQMLSVMVNEAQDNLLGCPVAIHYDGVLNLSSRKP